MEKTKMIKETNKERVMRENAELGVFINIEDDEVKVVSEDNDTLTLYIGEDCWEDEENA